MADRHPSICSFYLRNACARGDQCRFYHPQTSPSPSTVLSSMQSTKTGNICAHFLRGDCRFCEKCRDKHLPPASQSVSSQVPSSAPPKRFQASRNDGDTRPCIYFQQGSCRFGDQCRLSHSSDPAGTASSTFRAEGQTIADHPLHASPFRSPFGPCKFFAQGRCTKGAACSFPHIPVVSSGVPASVADLHPQHQVEKIKLPSELVVCPDEKKESNTLYSLYAAVDFAHVPSGNNLRQDESAEFCRADDQVSRISRQFYGCTVEVSSGATIQSVTTAFDSPRIIISNLPPTVTQAELMEFTEPFGDLRTANLMERSSTEDAMAIVEYMSPEHAARAVNELNGKRLGAQKLAARLDLRRGASGTAVLQSNKVKLTWFAPSRIAWAHYDSITGARAASKKLDGQEYDGRKVSATFQTPSIFQRTSFSVELKGLPAHATHTRLARWCDASSLKLGPMSYDEHVGKENVQHLLREHGALDAFDVLPNTSVSKMKITAFAQFSTAEAAADAVRAIHGKKQSFLRYSTIYLEVVHAVKGTLSNAQYLVVKKDLECLCATLEGCRMRIYDSNDAGDLVDPVGYRIYGSDAKAVGRTRLQLDRLLDGDILASDPNTDGALWDEYFQSIEGSAFLDKCSEVGAFVKSDPRTRTIRLCGPSEAKEQARTRILVRLAIIKGQRHGIPLERAILPVAMSSMQLLQEAAGSAKLSLNVVARTLVVRGDDEDVERVRRAVASLSSSDRVRSDDASCPVCFCEVADPSPLSCGHMYCRSCLQLLLKSAAGPDFSSSSLRCVHTMEREGLQVACGAPIPTSALRDLLSPPEETRLLSAAFLAHIHARSNEFHYCPTPDCEIIYRTGRAGAVLQCPACVARICPACHCEFHEGLSCAEHRDNVSGGHAAFDRWRLENGVKPCPNCQADLQKNGGCNHIKCIRCGTHMCWVCMETFSGSGTGGGVYGHMQRVHGGIGV